MNRNPARRVLAALAGSALAVTLATACSAGSTEARDTGVAGAGTPVEEGAYPVTIEHALGRTTIESEPTRVGTIGWTEHDFTAHDLNLAAWYADHLVAMRRGRVVAEGAPTDVVTERTVHAVFGLDNRVITDPVARTPLVVPVGRHHRPDAQSDVPSDALQPGGTR